MLKNGQFHSMQAYISRPKEGVIRLTSYHSIVADYEEENNFVTLYPRWNYSPTTWRQVQRFIEEASGVNVPKRYINETIKLGKTLLWILQDSDTNLAISITKEQPK